MTGESGAQRFINSLGEGRGYFALRVFVFVCFFLSLFALFARCRFAGLSSPDAMDCAQLASNVADGRGFSTRCIRPADLWVLSSEGRGVRGRVKLPDIRNAPVYPAILAVFLKVINPSREVIPGALYAPETSAIVPLGIICAMASCLFLFLTARRVFTERTAIIASVLFLLSNIAMRDSVSGTSLSMATLFTCSTLYFLVLLADRADSEDPARGGIWAPLLLTSLSLALAALTRYPLLLLIPSCVLMLSTTIRRNPWRLIGLLLCITVFLLLPWFVRNIAVSGRIFGSSPYECLQGSRVYGGLSFDRSVHPSVGISRAVYAVRAKLLSNFGRFDSAPAGFPGSMLPAALFVVSFFHRFRTRRANLLRWAIALAAALAMAADALGAPAAPPLLHTLLPAAIIFGTAFFFDLLERLDFEEAGMHTVITGALVALTALPAMLELASPRAPVPYPPYYPPFIRYVSDMMKPDETICSDIPWAVAWYGRGRSVLLPRSVPEFGELERSFGAMNGLYLTSETTHMLALGREEARLSSSWAAVLNGMIPEDFHLKHGISIPPETRDQLFLTDKIRWPENRKTPLAEDSGEIEISPAKGR